MKVKCEVKNETCVHNKSGYCNNIIIAIDKTGHCKTFNNTW